MAKPELRTFDRDPTPEAPAPVPAADVSTPAADMNAYVGPKCSGCGAELTGPLSLTMTSCDACWRRANVIGQDRGPVPGHASVKVRG